MPAQPQVVPDAVADVFPRPLQTVAQSKAAARNRRPAQPKGNGFRATLFPRLFETDRAI
ncbi:MAG: hypothetical protein IJO40_12840 [Thermoguttaceae bacterium]|nr:hypothetical protein [Thermoguttaceae bacterium]